MVEDVDENIFINIGELGKGKTSTKKKSVVLQKKKKKNGGKRIDLKFRKLNRN